jgi:hypothetical protein
MGVDQLYLRYHKFKELTFPAIPKTDWNRCFQDLVTIEEGLVFGDAIGKCDALPFTFEVENKEPIRSKPIMYAKAEREWIN